MTEKVEPYKGIAAVYDEIRPSYPGELIQDIISKTNLRPCDRLLELGAGTGKATIQLAEKGFSIHALDGLDEETVIKMDNEIIEAINSCGGYVGAAFKFSLFINRKVI